MQLQRPTFSGNVLELLGAVLYEYYDLGLLFRGDINGVAEWFVDGAIQRALGPIPSDLVNEAVWQTWSRWYKPDPPPA